MTEQKRRTISDRHGNLVCLTQKRWEHIIEPINHPEMSDCEEHLKETVRLGMRKQDSLNPQKYRYIRASESILRTSA